ncbi:MAG: hypothetical protein H6612_00545 [Ignavibacteriales bacterium]|nr:hypothetical protein [Ignavibacteriales bacterium]MCB9257812.1 hypothetical protein [Ignavibacteriales bacterium]
MKNFLILQFFITLAAFSLISAQNQISEDEVKNSLTKIFDLSKNQNFDALASQILYNEKNEKRAYNKNDANEAKSVKRMAKKIKAYLDLSDSYEYESLTNLKVDNLPAAELKVNFRSGDQKLTITFDFVKLNGNLLLENFK